MLLPLAVYLEAVHTVVWHFIVSLFWKEYEAYPRPFKFILIPHITQGWVKIPKVFDCFDLKKNK